MSNLKNIEGEYKKILNKYSEYFSEQDKKQQDILQAFEKVCENSVYSYRRQICDGYITIRGGNRVGIVGSAVLENGQVINMNYI